MGNQPINFNDPTGHEPGSYCDRGYCDSKGNVIKADSPKNKFFSKPNKNEEDFVDSVLGAVLGAEGAELLDTILMAESGQGHYYSSGPHYACLPLSWINCTDTETDDYLSRFQYPGQLPSQPAVAGRQYNVFPEKFPWGGNTPIGYFWPGSGHIFIRKDGNTVTNVAFTEHIFDGTVDRVKSYDGNGIPMVTTIGRGVNPGFDVYNGQIFPGTVIDIANHYVGPFAFTQIDKGLLVYTTWVETAQYLSGTQQLR